MTADAMPRRPYAETRAAGRPAEMVWKVADQRDRMVCLDRTESVATACRKVLHCHRTWLTCASGEE